MRFSIILVPILTLVSCTTKQPENIRLTSDTLKQNIKKEQTANAHPGRPSEELIYASYNVKILGDTTIDKEKIYRTSVKFEPYISFEDFKSEKIETGKAKLDFSSNRDAYNFRTRIRAAYEADTPNFAGHYTFVHWGCGSPCQDGVIVDRRTGRIYDAPDATRGYDFRADSRMLLANPPDDLGFYDDCFYCKPLLYILDEKTKHFTERLPN